MQSACKFSNPRNRATHVIQTFFSKPLLIAFKKKLFLSHANKGVYQGQGRGHPRKVHAKIPATVLPIQFKTVFQAIFITLCIFPNSAVTFAFWTWHLFFSWLSEAAPSAPQTQGEKTCWDFFKKLFPKAIQKVFQNNWILQGLNRGRKKSKIKGWLASSLIEGVQRFSKISGCGCVFRWLQDEGNKLMRWLQNFQIFTSIFKQCRPVKLWHFIFFQDQSTLPWTSQPTKSQTTLGTVLWLIWLWMESQKLRCTQLLLVSTAALILSMSISLSGGLWIWELSTMSAVSKSTIEETVVVTFVTIALISSNKCWSFFNISFLLSWFQ